MSWAIWITGRPGSGKTTLARRVAERLREGGVTVRVLDRDAVHERLFADRQLGEHEQDTIHRVLAYAAALLTEAGVPVIVDATASRRAWREMARTSIPRFAEIQLLCPTETCLERERAVRWGLTDSAPPPRPASTPDIALDYEESARAEVSIRTDVQDVQAATERVLAVIQRLAGRAARA